MSEFLPAAYEGAGDLVLAEAVKSVGSEIR